MPRPRESVWRSRVPTARAAGKGLQTTRTNIPSSLPPVWPCTIHHVWAAVRRSQAALANCAWRSSQRPFDPVSRLLPPNMTLPEHKPQQGDGSSPTDTNPLGDFPALEGEEHSLACRTVQE